jgi:hypothetical protein
MKTSLQVFLAGLVLLTPGFAQEPKQALAKHVSSGESRKETVVSGAPLLPAPVLQPKALPPLNPPLGDIARLARVAHAAAPKAQVVVETDAAQQKPENSQNPTTIPNHE